VTKFLEEYRVGRLSDWEGEGEAKVDTPGSSIVAGLIDNEEDDVYVDDPTRAKEQLVFFKQPFNTETRSGPLKRQYLTPNDIFYVR
jgi:hypothetical protein